MALLRTFCRKPRLARKRQLLHIIKDKLDEETQRQWANRSAQNATNSFNEFFKFLESRCFALELYGKAPETRGGSRAINQKPVTPKRVQALNTTSRFNCVHCNGSHFISNCRAFKNLKLTERRKKASDYSLCFNCLKPNHSYTECKSEYSCLICKKKHNTLLHPVEESVEKDLGQIEGMTISNLARIESVAKGMLATAIVLAENAIGDLVKCRALIDPGSETSFVTANLAAKLHLPPKFCKVQVAGLQGRKAEIANTLYTIKLKSFYSEDCVLIEALKLSKIAGNIPMDERTVNYKLFHGKPLADPNFFKPGQIDVLIGAKEYYDLIRPQQILKFENGLRLMNTIFGWLVGGRCAETNHVYVNNCRITNLTSIEEQLRKFWECEELNPDRSDVEQEDLCEKFYKETTERTQGGRYVVRLPFCSHPPDLGSSFSMALKSLYFLEKKFQRSPEFEQLYRTYMNSYENDGHMEKVPSNEIGNMNSCYIPHHGVMKNNKVRVVFNAAAKTSNGQSINDQLFTGPKLQTDLRQILMRGRFFQYIVGTDISKMFCQVRVNAQDTDYLRILWRQSPSQPVATYRMVTVPFGLDCSPFLAQRTIHQLISDQGSNYPTAARVLTLDRYVDDIYHGANSVDELIETRDQLIQLLRSGGFELRKWYANHPSILDGLPDEVCSTEKPKLYRSDSVIESLGVRWTPVTDTFSFKIPFDGEAVYTKRMMLSELARIYDPFGWLSPVTVFIKILLQDLWRTQLGWDDKLPDNVIKSYSRLREQLPSVESISVPRCIGSHGPYEIFGFSDASRKAYGAVVYVRDANQEVMHLLISKTRVAPLTEATIPRLELCAALILARIIRFVISSIDVTISDMTCFTDSKVVLTWLCKPPTSLKVFVKNRVEEIHRLTPHVRWSYVPTNYNPADLCSRGVQPEQLIDNDLWWHGPNIEEFRDKILAKTDFDDIGAQTEMKLDAVQTYSTQASDFDLIDRFSNLKRLLRVTACCLRWRSKIGSFPSADGGVHEINNAMLALVKYEQTQHFQLTIQRLRNGKPLKKSDPLLELNPFIDEHQLLRVGGRLTKANIAYNCKHPIIIPRQSKLAVLMVVNEHIEHNHIGYQTILSNLRQNHWIIRANSLIKRTLRSCLVCFKSRPIAANQLMGSLPIERTTPNPAFSHVGIDFAGPFSIKTIRQRGVTTFKAYVAVFVCLSTKAVHLEAVTTLTKEGCLAAIARFVSRRGRPVYIVSDNGTNLVGSSRFLDAAAAILKSAELNEKIASALTTKGINWRFIPARSPEFGGLWEAQVKSMKGCLLKCAGNSKLTSEEFGTLLCQIEAALNMRPLCYVDSNPGNFEPLTPAHFLIGRHLRGLPEMSLMNDKLSLGARWSFVQSLFREFWVRWSRESIPSLQARKTNSSIKANVKVGDVGIMKEDNLLPMNWRLCRIERVYPGSDGLVRVVELRVGHKLFKRSINSFYRLPVVSSRSEDTGEDV